MFLGIKYQIKSPCRFYLHIYMKKPSRRTWILTRNICFFFPTQLLACAEPRRLPAAIGQIDGMTSYPKGSRRYASASSTRTPHTCTALRLVHTCPGCRCRGCRCRRHDILPAEGPRRRQGNRRCEAGVILVLVALSSGQVPRRELSIKNSPFRESKR